MLVEPCADVGCDCYTCYECSACHLPYCLSHLHPIILAPGIHMTLCQTCNQHQDLAMQTALHDWHNETHSPA